LPRHGIPTRKGDEGNDNEALAKILTITMSPSPSAIPSIRRRGFSVDCRTGPEQGLYQLYGTELTFWQIREQVLRLANALAAKA